MTKADKTIEAEAMDLLLHYENGLTNCGLEPHNIDYDKLANHRKKYATKLSEMYEAGKREEREKRNKLGRKYNKNPQRMLKSKHRYHKRIGKIFNNCELCRKEK